MRIFDAFDRHWLNVPKWVYVALAAGFYSVFQVAAYFIDLLCEFVYIKDISVYGLCLKLDDDFRIFSEWFSVLVPFWLAPVLYRLAARAKPKELMARKICREGEFSFSCCEKSVTGFYCKDIEVGVWWIFLDHAQDDFLCIAHSEKHGGNLNSPDVRKYFEGMLISVLTKEGYKFENIGYSFEGVWFRVEFDLGMI